MKSKLILLLCMTFLCGTLRAQTITKVQAASSTGTTGVTSKAVAYTSNPAAGNLLIVCDNWGNNVGTHSVSDTLTNTWTEFLSNARGITGLNDLTCFWAKNVSTGADTVTVSVSGGGTHTLRVAIFEYSSSTGWPATPADQHNAASNATASCCTTGNPGNITPSSSGTLIFSALQTGSAGLSGITLSGCTEQPAGGTAGTGWLSDARADSADVEGASTAAQTCTYSWTGNSAWSAIIQNFTPSAGGGGGSTPKQLTTLGVGQLAYNINYQNLAAFNANGCVAGDMSCSEEVDLCDESNNCLHFLPGPHTVTLNFLKNGAPTQVATSSFTVSTQ